jgi:hypothetical protein
MKYTLIMACTLSAVYMTVQCMDKNNKTQLQPLLLGESSTSAAMNNGSINADPDEQLHASTCAGTSSSSGASGNFYIDLLDAMEKGADQKEAFAKTMRSIAPGLPQPNDVYTGALYPANTVTNFQFWNAYNIPPDEIYRSGVQLDEYVANRQAQANARACNRCCGQTCGWVSAAAVAAGCITGIVYLHRWLKSCDNENVYNPDCNYNLPTPPLPPYSQSYSQNYTSQSQSYSQNYTLQVITALVNESKKMK